MRKLKLGLASLAAVAVLAGCSSVTALTDASGSQSTATGNSGNSEALTALLSENQKSHYTQDDSGYDESFVTQITLNGSSVTASGSDLSIDGNGSLSVTGSNNDAINSADGLVIAGGNITVKAADDGIRERTTSSSRAGPSMWRPPGTASRDPTTSRYREAPSPSPTPWRPSRPRPS